MPEAIDTKRRRFTKALDNITGSNTSPNPSVSGSTTSNKRPATATAAFDEARERASKRLRHSTSSTSFVRTSSKPKSDDSKVSKEPPNFAPWSHEAFLTRLKTFSSVSLWHPKPEVINEVEWAKRGWRCVVVNTVACKGGCEKRVVVSVDIPKKASRQQDEDDAEASDEEESEEGSAFEQALADRYKGVVADGHSLTCLWRQGGCKDDIYHLQVVRPSVWQPELRKRYQSVIAISSAIEKVNLKPADRSEPKSLSSGRLLKDLPQDIVSDATNTPEATAATCLDVALHGWRGSTESGSELLHCDACFQRIGLWMYQPNYRVTHPDSDEENDKDGAVVDLVEMHRDHCSWRNATSQKASGTLAGLNACEILQRVVSTYARDHRRRSEEQSAVQIDGAEDQDGKESLSAELPVVSREEIVRQDKERESRLRKLKSLFTIKRRSAKT